jgi:hypothetical protein
LEVSAYSVDLDGCVGYVLIWASKVRITSP